MARLKASQLQIQFCPSKDPSSKFNLAVSVTGQILKSHLLAGENDLVMGIAEGSGRTQAVANQYLGVGLNDSYVCLSS